MSEAFFVTSDPLLGKVVGGSYRILRTLGQGAMGVVYLAEHTQLKKFYALKLLLREASLDPEISARFEREAVAAGKIHHPNVVAASDCGRLDDGGLFLVLEYVEGKNLRQVLKSGPLSPLRALEIVRQVLRALAAAHALGIVHRDIKPENIMLVERSSQGSFNPDSTYTQMLVHAQDWVKVLDFGIAKVDPATLGQSSAQLVTKIGTVFGTPTYMAPEQALGQTLDARADVYGVGIILFELIAGKPPFQGEGLYQLAQHCNEPPPELHSPIEPHGVTPGIRQLVLRMLEKNRDGRPDAQQALSTLEQVIASHSAELQTNPSTEKQASQPISSVTAPSSASKKKAPKDQRVSLARIPTHVLWIALLAFFVPLMIGLLLLWVMT